MSGLFLASLLVATATSFFVGIGLVMLKPHIEMLSRSRNDDGAVQASHEGSPLRFGGVAAVAGLLVGVIVLSPQLGTDFAFFLLLSVSPVMIVGIYEDSGRLVSPRGRLIAGAISAATAVALLGLWAPRADLPLLDTAMTFVPVAIVLTVFFTSGFCHAVNMIDGMNGLAAAVIMLSAAGIAVIGYSTDLGEISVLACLLAAATFGFFVLNWPIGRLFLGDAGAYGLGHLLVWLAISEIALAPNVAVPAILLTLFWPLMDLVHTVLRRMSSGQPVFSPDRMHLHQKIRRGLEIVVVGRNNRSISNPLTTLILTPMIVAPVLTGVLLFDNATLGWVVLLVYGILFAATNVLVVRYSAKRLKYQNIRDRESRSPDDRASNKRVIGEQS